MTTRKSAAEVGQDGIEALVKKAMAGAGENPEPELPSDNLVKLPGGLVRGDDVISTAEVKELTGVDEEALVRAARSKVGDVFHFMNVLLEQGVVRIGNEDPKETKKLLKTMLIGDRDALIYGIRRATYGDDIKMEKWQCTNCGNSSDLVIPIDDVPMEKLKDPKDQTLTVPLKRGRKAKVRMLNGDDQLAVFDREDLNPAERDTMVIQRSLMSITEADGTEKTTIGHATAYARSMSMPDRHAVTKALTEGQPGPREVKITHETCGEEVSVSLGIGVLFPDIVLV